MQIAGRKRFVTLMSWVVIFANPLPILAFAGSEHDLLAKTPTPRQIEAQATSASSLVLEPSSVAFPVPSPLGSSTIDQTGGVILFGLHAGDEIAPWNGAAHPTAMAMARWVSATNNDSLYGGIDSLNGGRFTDGHDNLLQFNLTWTHRLNERGTFLTSTETYCIFQTHALVGGTVTNGPPRSFFQGVGPGVPISGNAPAFGVVIYT